MDRQIVEERVQAGAGLLDVARPGWESEINLDELIMGDRSSCVLGQLYPCYVKGIRALGLKEEEGYLFGFHIRVDLPEPEFDIEVRNGSLLDEVWKDLTRKRQTANTRTQSTLLPLSFDSSSV